jgi:hypothetical protein
MFGGRSRRKQRASGTAWTSQELAARQYVYDLLKQWARDMPVAPGISAVLSAPDRDGFLAAIEQHPELLTDEGNKGFESIAVWSVLMGAPRVTDWVRQGQATVQAVREARA